MNSLRRHGRPLLRAVLIAIGLLCTTVRAENPDLECRVRVAGTGCPYLEVTLVNHGKPISLWSDWINEGMGHPVEIRFLCTRDLSIRRSLSYGVIADPAIGDFTLPTGGTFTWTYNLGDEIDPEQPAPDYVVWRARVGHEESSVFTGIRKLPLIDPSPQQWLADHIQMIRIESATGARLKPLLHSERLHRQLLDLYLRVQAEARTNPALTKAQIRQRLDQLCQEWRRELAAKPPSAPPP